ncbi:hypothetical protein B0E38_06492 [Streptomyces sp. 111WW2]|uniref:Uncharacterized protein n=1 Tax=Streptomyces violaceoruber TaxID=1935 RepID=A0ACD4WRS4_STRVN|nr:hypothetical protein [Streptomyces sp. LRa12]PSK47900.1 hypothetical protein B0E38_06492 [Streptomyces sp. 111WW2]WOZ00193.1 hypothetical protein R2E43_23175 [Streptomyces violaceoruber]
MADELYDGVAPGPYDGEADGPYDGEAAGPYDGEAPGAEEGVAPGPPWGGGGEVGGDAGAVGRGWVRVMTLRMGVPVRRPG